jgi:hypothetical protein
LDNEVELIGLSRFLQFRSVFCLRTLLVWSCSFRKLHSHHHEIFYRQEQASLPLLRPKKTPLHGKKRASPSVGGVAFADKLPKNKCKYLCIFAALKNITHYV